ncbi:MAG: Serine/threonine-protein kinase PknH [Pseudomonadota bacterium]|jgi:Tol biopolymer transport system component
MRGFSTVRLLALLIAFGGPYHSTHVLAQTPPSAYEMALVDLRGRKTVLGRVPSSVFAPRLSPDGRQVVFEMADDADAAKAGGSGAASAPLSLWVAPLADLSQRRVLPKVGTGRNWAAVWSTDGQRLAFQVSVDRPDTLYWRRADGSDEAEQLVEGRAAEALVAGDRQLFFLTLQGKGDYGIGMLDLPTRTVTTLVDREDSAQHSSRLSPDGHWLAYASDESGRQEVWLLRLGRPDLRYRITEEGGRHPLWSRDGKFLYFDRPDGLYRIELFLGSEIPKAGPPKALPIRGFQQGELRRQYDLMPDGRRFLMLYPAKLD